MAADKTVVTELCTALGMLGYARVDAAVLDRSPRLAIEDPTWDHLGELLNDRSDLRPHAETAFGNGTRFLDSPDGLGGRVPRTVIWAGGRRPPGDEVVPADLLVDHVYLVSCKYRSKVLHNAAPARLFDDLLMSVDRRRRGDWYVETAPAETQELFEVTRSVSGLDTLPPAVVDLTASDRAELKQAGRGPVRSEIEEATGPAYAELVRAVSDESARRWRSQLSSPERRERMLWRLLRIYGAPYFVVGHDGRSGVAVRIATPWDWRQRYALGSFHVEPARVGQPQVDWAAEVEDRSTGEPLVVAGHVEVRWSHGRFAQPPEAKVYLDTPHHRVPGYEPLG